MVEHNGATGPGVVDNGDNLRERCIWDSNEKKSTQRGQSGGRQYRLDKWLPCPAIPNTKACGDSLRERSDGYEILRVGFQNIRGTDMINGFAVAPELDAMDDIVTHVKGMAESNKPWN